MKRERESEWEGLKSQDGDNTLLDELALQEKVQGTQGMYCTCTIHMRKMLRLLQQIKVAWFELLENIVGSVFRVNAQ